MNSRPLVSVIVTIYRTEKYLRECVDSLLCQTLQDIEIILVDDGSPDSCPEICDLYAQQDTRIRVIHKTNGGVLRARITGVEAATADFIGFVDGDDTVEPTFFQTLYETAQKNQAQIVCSTWMVCYDNGNRKKQNWSYPQGLFSDQRLQEELYPLWFEDRLNGITGITKNVWSKLFKRSLLQRIYADIPVDVDISEDAITTYGCIAIAERIVTLPDCALYNYRILQNSLSHKYWNNALHNSELVVDYLRRMECLPQAEPFRQEALPRLTHYKLYDMLINECKPNRTTSAKQRRELIRHILSNTPWKEVVGLNEIPTSNISVTLLRKAMTTGRLFLIETAMWIVTQKMRIFKLLKR